MLAVVRYAAALALVSSSATALLLPARPATLARRALLGRLPQATVSVAAVVVAATLTSSPPAAGAAVAGAAPPQPEARSKPQFRRVPRLQFVAALGDPAASSGTGAAAWGLWVEDPGPRGVRLGRAFDQLASASASGGKAPAGWTFDSGDWWLEEHGLIMEAPPPLPAKRFDRDSNTVVPLRRYVVTGDRELTTVLTVHADGRWALAQGALRDVTHLPCRSARYTPAAAGVTCSPARAAPRDFPVKPGAAMPTVPGCTQVDYAVLFVVGVEA